ncbi:MAG: dihydroneopterin aldolase [Betaproteobacteria bacterium]|nr:dihydroneopterin aldolase [Betaproteobacteria bacterium]
MSESLLHIHPLGWRREEESDVRALFLKNFVTLARVGVYEHEKQRAQRVRFDLVVYLKPPFDWHDRLEDVLDYDRLRQGVLDILSAGHINLLETLGERIVGMCFRHGEVQAVHLQVAKLEAHADCEVGYEMRRHR